MLSNVKTVDVVDEVLMQFSTAKLLLYKAFNQLLMLLMFLAFSPFFCTSV